MTVAARMLQGHNGTRREAIARVVADVPYRGSGPRREVK
jgi:hypothetical protein